MTLSFIKITLHRLHAWMTVQASPKLLEVCWIIPHIFQWISWVIYTPISYIRWLVVWKFYLDTLVSLAKFDGVNCTEVNSLSDFHSTFPNNFLIIVYNRGQWRERTCKSSFPINDSAKADSNAIITFLKCRHMTTNIKMK